MKMGFCSSSGRSIRDRCGELPGTAKWFVLIKFGSAISRQPPYSGHFDYIDIVLIFNKSPRRYFAMAWAGAISPIEP